MCLELNLCQRRWLEFLKDYDMSVHYHPGKANVLANTLRRLFMGSVPHVEKERNGLLKDVHKIARLRSPFYEHIRQWCNSSE